jgi:hypothetical protein
MRYHLGAGILGAGWFVVLPVPGLTREYVLKEPWWNLAFLVTASVAVAVLARRARP